MPLDQKAITKQIDDILAKCDAHSGEPVKDSKAAGAVYSTLDQKSVTAWLDLRNKAAHGKFT